MDCTLFSGILLIFLLFLSSVTTSKIAMIGSIDPRNVPYHSVNLQCELFTQNDTFSISSSVGICWLTENTVP